MYNWYLKSFINQMTSSKTYLQYIFIVNASKIVCFLFLFILTTSQLNADSFFKDFYRI
jgi:hypothetical protein